MSGCKLEYWNFARTSFDSLLIDLFTWFGNFWSSLKNISEKLWIFLEKNVLGLSGAGDKLESWNFALLWKFSIGEGFGGLLQNSCQHFLMFSTVKNHTVYGLISLMIIEGVSNIFEVNFTEIVVSSISQHLAPRELKFWI
jgi:hypothetical protein